MNDTDPNGHSLLERLEFWKTGIAIARDHPIFGTGIGDVQDTFNRYYEAEESKLVEENRNRTHNMILTTMISMGIVGLFLFLWFHSYFIQQAIRKENYPGIAFFTLLIVSYMIEDTLETQVGVSLAGFFLAYFNIDKSQTHL